MLTNDQGENFWRKNGPMKKILEKISLKGKKFFEKYPQEGKFISFIEFLEN